MYMLGASRRNAAFMYLGVAVRAAYALGLHKADITTLFASSEFQTRERLWKVILILDLFMSASLGRPPSTSETRDTESPDNYSASVDLCGIFEAMLTEIYPKRMVSTQVLETISEHHRRWTASFHQGLATDRIDGQNALEQGRTPNIGLLHMKEVYYWAIILMTRPFYIEYVTDNIAKTVSITAPADTKKSSPTTSNEVLAYSCVDSAVRTIDLLKVLIDFKRIPKRLPFIVNSIFVSALVLGLGYFADLNTTFPLEQGLMMAQKLLALFPNDAVARRHWNIVEYLRDACSTYLRQKAAPNMSRQAQRVHGIFGHITEGPSLCQTDFGGRRSSTDAGDIRHQNDDDGQKTGSTRLTGHRANGTIDTGPEVQGLRTSGAYDSTFNSGEADSFDAIGDAFATPLMSPQTLWFASYEANPLFSTLDATTASTR